MADIGEIAAIAFDEPARFLGKEIEIAGDSLNVPAMKEALAKKRYQRQYPLLQ